MLCFIYPAVIGTRMMTIRKTQDVLQLLILTAWTIVEKRKSSYCMGLCLISRPIFSFHMLDPSQNLTLLLKARLCCTEFV